MRTVASSPLRVPVGPGAGRWTSRTPRRRVLLVVHNVTSAGRLLDILPLFHDDFRIQLLVTSTDSSAFQAASANSSRSWDSLYCPGSKLSPPRWILRSPPASAVNSP
ncbi:hypothetical protein [Streptomyces sp. NPDC006552]|uniref:hypothetical protein n=1 Tax=Streptomyces sp. NPDC006552 TaxID=3157179 RepID=UPI0033ACF8E7